MEIEYKQTKDFTADELQKLFYPFTGNPAIIPKTCPCDAQFHTSYFCGDGDKLVGLVRALDDGETVAFCMIFWWTLLIRDSTLEMS